jgi:FlaA1/EpsC-like NDP-sugar epimerase
LKGTKIVAFAEAVAAGVPIKFIGLRGHEKIHEDLVSQTEMLYVVDMGEFFKIVPPEVNNWELGWDVKYPDEPKVKPFVYSSNTVEQLTKEELRNFDK